MAWIGGHRQICGIVIFMAEVTIYTGFVEDPNDIVGTNTMCSASIMPADVWFACTKELHGQEAAHQAEVLGEFLRWFDDGNWYVVNPNG